MLSKEQTQRTKQQRQLRFVHLACKGAALAVRVPRIQSNIYIFVLLFPVTCGLRRLIAKRQINAIISIKGSKTGLLIGHGIYEPGLEHRFICGERGSTLLPPHLHQHLATLNLGQL